MSYFRSSLMLAFCLGLFSAVSAKDCLQAADGFAVRGFHLDLRIQVMKMPALKEFTRKLSENGVNTLIMEWEAAYPYRKHPVISNRYAYSREEVKSFVTYCNTLGIDVIPLQQSFGHVEYILRHYRYRDLREDQKDYSQVNPLKEELCRELFTDLYRDLIETHTSGYIHIGGDETYLLGHSKESQEKIAKVGKGRLYGDYLKMLCELVVSLGKRPIVWADIALKYPDAFSDLPKETVFVDWNYGWPLDRFGDHGKLLESGFEIWGAPAIRSHPDNYFLVDWNKHFENIKTFIPQARVLGYRGIVMTSWSTSGIYSPVFESSTDIIDLHAIRRVYPVSGFNMLIAAYFESLKSEKPLDTWPFVKRYASEKYGLDSVSAAMFWRALTLAPYEVSQGVVSKQGFTVSSLRDSASLAANLLHQLRPSKNKEEFAHYLLMGDIRVYYLTCMLVESQLNHPGMPMEDVSELDRALRGLRPKKLDKRFIKLNESMLYRSELDLENELRNKRLQSLLDKLGNIKNTNAEKEKYLVNGYISGKRGLVDASVIDVAKLTHINYAFVNVKDSMAHLTNLATDSVNFRRLNELKQRKNPALKILISIGGWSWSENFSDAVLTASSRKKFASSSVDIVRQYKLDGVDVDWEYPGMPGEEGNVYRSEDKRNYTLMFEALRSELDQLEKETGNDYELTAAVGGSQAFVDNTEMQKVGRILDHVLIMTYDYGGGSNTVNHHTNLYPSKQSASAASAHRSVQNFIAAGIPAEKIVIGAAFYGKALEAASSKNKGLGQPKATTQGQGGVAEEGGGFTRLKETSINKNGYKSYWDKHAKAPYLFNKRTNVFITYDDERSINEKIRYMKTYSLAGIFFWEYFNDPGKYLLNTIHEGLQ